MEKYQDRSHAGQTLAPLLNKYQNDAQTIVLALPRGGVPVGYEIAKYLHVSIDVFVVRKLGVPQHNELAFGAMASGNVTVFNDWVIKSCGITPRDIEAVIGEEKKELARRETAYRGNLPFPELKQKNVILVDDGMATGATLRAAIKALRMMQALKIIVALPVAPLEEAEKMKILVEEWICPLAVPSLNAVGEWYEDFSQTEDEEVYRLLSAP